ncbi:hypothetical protein BC826DRAFT_973831 [Russula brevipes]|nr:hypothetical protein BC826DRAFT_973831 [Russula brevipes]
MTMAPSPISPGEFEKSTVKAKSAPFQRHAWHGRMERRGGKGAQAASCQPRKHGSRHFENRKTGRGGRCSRARFSLPFPSWGDKQKAILVHHKRNKRKGRQKLDTPNPIITWSTDKAWPALTCICLLIVSVDQTGLYRTIGAVLYCTVNAQQHPPDDSDFRASQNGREKGTRSRQISGQWPSHGTEQDNAHTGLGRLRALAPLCICTHTYLGKRKFDKVERKGRQRGGSWEFQNLSPPIGARPRK